MNVNLPCTPPAYSKGWADALTSALKNAFAQINAAGATITLPYGATLTLTAPDGKRWTVSVSAAGALVVTAV
jgi:hypothetical protein